MKLSPLLEELISIAKKPKTDFALSMNMTPSGLSKILTGKRLPAPQGRKVFTKQAADYFTEAIYTLKCYTKFDSVFPVIYDFNSKDELRSFLTCAIEYALDMDFAAESNINFDYAERSMCSLGRKTVLNLLCLTLSDHLVSAEDTRVEIYITLSLLHDSLAKIFQRIRFIGLHYFHDTVLHCFFDEAALTAINGSYGSGALSLISKAERELGLDLNLWRITGDTGQPFLMIKGSVLLLFNDQIAGMPLMVPVYHKSALTMFQTALMTQEMEKVSYSRADAIAFLKEHSGFIPQLLELGIESAYNFISIGYLLEKTELEAAWVDTDLCKQISELFYAILSRETTFVVSFAAMERFVASGKAVVPLFGAIDIPSEGRVPYLNRFEAFLHNEKFSKIKLTNSDLTCMSIYCTRDVDLLYTVDDTYKREKIHVFKANQICGLLHDIKLLNLSPDLWQAYQKELMFGDTGIV